MACYPLQGLPMTIQFTQGDNMYDMQYTTAFTNLKMPRIGCDERRLVGTRISDPRTGVSL